MTLMYVCNSCGKRYEREDQLIFLFPNIPDLYKRISPGGIVPAAECRECEGLVYRADTVVRLLVLLEGGLVQAVLADRPDIEVAVLDQDTEGADEDEIVNVVGTVDTLRGTLEARHVIVAPVLIESAWRTTE